MGEIVKNTSDLLVYFVPGYLVFFMICYKLRTKITDDNYKITVLSVVISFFINEISMIFVSLFDLKINTNLPNIIIALFIVLIFRFLIKREIVVFNYFENSNTLWPFIFQDDVYDICCKVTLKNGLSYVGILKAVDDVNNSEILLSSYCIIAENNTEICNYIDDEDEHFILLSKEDIATIEIDRKKIK